MKVKIHTVITYTRSHKSGSKRFEDHKEKHTNLGLGTVFTMSERKGASQLVRMT
jgi:hypothetical protein